MTKPLQSTFSKQLFAFAFLIYPTALAVGAELDVWFVSSRNASRTATSSQGNHVIQYWKMENEHWKDSTQNEFIATQSPKIPVVFLFHGNWTNRYETVQLGGYAKRAIEKEPSNEKVRLVIWSWPSDRILSHVRPDIRLKAAWSDAQSFYVAELLAELPAQTRATLIGFSFGARISLGAAELLAGGKITGRTLANLRENSLSQINIILCAPALDQHWLSSNGRYKNALDLANHITILYNSVDRGLRFYPLIDSVGGPKALGLTGPANRAILRDARSKITSFDMRNVVGREHAFAPYLLSTTLMRQLGMLLKKP